MKKGEKEAETYTKHLDVWFCEGVGDVVVPPEGVDVAKEGVSNEPVWWGNCCG